jgi:hypothetical protein
MQQGLISAHRGRMHLSVLQKAAQKLLVLKVCRSFSNPRVCGLIQENISGQPISGHCITVNITVMGNNYYG